MATVDNRINVYKVTVYIFVLFIVFFLQLREHAEINFKENVNESSSHSFRFRPVRNIIHLCLTAIHLQIWRCAFSLRTVIEIINGSRLHKQNNRRQQLQRNSGKAAASLRIEPGSPGERKTSRWQFAQNKLWATDSCRRKSPSRSGRSGNERRPLGKARGPLENVPVEIRGRDAGAAESFREEIKMICKEPSMPVPSQHSIHRGCLFIGRVSMSQQRVSFPGKSTDSATVVLAAVEKARLSVIG